MDTCPHCNFLVRDDATTCGVCHRPVHADAGAPAYLAGDRRPAQVVSARIGSDDTGPPVAIMLLFVMVLVLAAALLVVSRLW